jgi:ribosome-associated protein
MKKTTRRSAKRPAQPKLSADLTAGIAAALGKKAQDVVVLDLTRASAFTDFFVICTGSNLRQVQAIASAVEEGLRKVGTKPALVEGYTRGEWVLIDCFDVIFHIFQPATREFYALERLWGGAERIEVSTK